MVFALSYISCPFLKKIFLPFETGSHYLSKSPRLTCPDWAWNCNSPALASQHVEIMGIYHHTWPNVPILWEKRLNIGPSLVILWCVCVCVCSGASCLNPRACFMLFSALSRHVQWKGFLEAARPPFISFFQFPWSLDFVFRSAGTLLQNPHGWFLTFLPPGNPSLSPLPFAPVFNK